MKKSVALALLLLLPVGAQAKPAQKMTQKSGSIVWRTDYDAAMKEARRSGKPVFVDFYTDWCTWCKVLDQKTYRAPKFVRASRDWVMVKLNAEKGARNVQLRQQFKVNGFPFLLMLDPHEKVLNTVPGYCPTSALLSEMRKAQSANGVLSARNPVARRAG